MHSAERLLRLLGLLQGRVDWTADDLARRLEVTPRTIRRDIARLRELGYPVEAMAGPGGGYRLGAGGKLPPLLLDDEEALAVALGLRVSMATVGGLEEASLSAMGKLEQVLPPRIRQRVEDFSEATVTVPGYPVRVDPVVVAVVTRASRERQRIRFSYRDARGAESERHAEPLRMVHTGRRWYLVAYDMDREDWRSFRVDRMKDARPTGMRSMRRPAPDPVEMINQGVAVDVYSRSAEVILHVPIDIAQRMIPITIGRLEEEGSDRSRLLIGADEMGGLASFLVSLAVPFDVVSPDDLKAELVALGKELIERHG